MRVGKRTAAVAAALVMAACGSPAGSEQSGFQASTARTGSLSSPSAPPSLSGLFVLMSQDTNSMATVRLLDANGRVHASAQFTPPTRPAYGPCGSLVQPWVRVAHGAAYFVDSAGVVRSLTPTGAVTQVATFPMTKGNQALSYAVSPDGSQLIAIVFNTPPLHSPPPQTLGDQLFDPGTWSIDLERAPAGGSTSTVLHRDLGTQVPPSPTVITGWDNFGPTATLNSRICTQNTLPSFAYNGTLIHLALDGTHLDRIGGSTCNAYDELMDGTVLCAGASWPSFSVRDRGGDELWSRTVDQLQDVRLAPDGNAVASGEGTIYARYTDQPASFARTGIPQAQIIGWAGPGYAVGLRPDGHVGLVAAADPLAFSDLGVTIQIPCPGCAPYGIVIGTIA